MSAIVSSCLGVSILRAWFSGSLAYRSEYLNRKKYSLPNNVNDENNFSLTPPSPVLPGYLIQANLHEVQAIYENFGNYTALFSLLCFMITLVAFSKRGKFLYKGKGNTTDGLILPIHCD